MIIQGLARTQIPTNTNYAVEFPTFGEIAGVNPTEVQWKGLALEEPPSWSRLTSQPGKYELLLLFQTVLSSMRKSVKLNFHNGNWTISAFLAAHALNCFI